MTQKARYARVRPEVLKVVEAYAYSHELAHNQEFAEDTPPAGAIELSIPYDGREHFTRTALVDLRGPDATLDLPARAVIGHLAVTTRGLSDLARRLALAERHGTYPLSIPLRGDGLDSDTDLVADRHECTLRLPYAPRAPEVPPIEVTIELHDEPWVGEDSPLPNEVAPHLEFRVQVHVHLPRSAGTVKPRLSRLFLAWPTVPSLETLRVEIEGARNRPHPLMFVPLEGGIAWGDVPLQPAPTGGDVQSYSTPHMRLVVDHPADLFRQKMLTGRADVEVPECALSGVRLSYYGATGRRVNEAAFTMRTQLQDSFHLRLEDAFRQRTRSVFQRLHFEGVKLEPLRIRDIETLLTGRGFNLDRCEGPLREDDRTCYVVRARRSGGVHKVRLTIMVEGHRRLIDVVTREGGQERRTTLESGEVTLAMRAWSNGESAPVVHEFNALQRVLRQSFEKVHVQAR